MAIMTNSLPQPIGNTYRGLGADWFNAENIAKEDYYRQLQQIDFQNQFNAQEAQKNRDWQQYLTENSYQIAVEDMKKAGLNPLMAFSSGGASTPSGAVAQSGYQSAYKGRTADTASFVKTVGEVLAFIAGKLPVKSGKIGF